MDSNLYERGKILLSKRSENKHEELREKLYISKPGHIETYLVNETSEDVWFDNFRIESTPPLIVQETHYDPWGLELTGLKYQYEGIKVNKYLYQGKEMMDDHNLNIYDFHARGYDPVIGRTLQVDPGSESYYPISPYSWVMNNPLKFVDPTGMFADYFDRNGAFVGSDNVDDKEIRIFDKEKKSLSKDIYESDGKTINRQIGMSNSSGLGDSKNISSAQFGIVEHYYREAGYDPAAQVWLISGVKQSC